jgi:hypothetical protein
MDINIILQLIPLILVLCYPLQDQFVASIMSELWFESGNGEEKSILNCTNPH